MQAAAAPASIRGLALGVIARRLGGPVSVESKLAEAGGEALADILVALERAFGIDLDPDELWPDITACGLAALAEAKAADKPRLALVPPDPPRFPIPAQPEPWLDRAPIVRPRTARELRTEAALAQAAEELRTVGRLVAHAVLLASFAAIVLFGLGLA